MLPFELQNPVACAILAPGRPELSHGELARLVARIGSQLRAAGIGRDGRVVAPNGPEAGTAFLAIASACQCAPLNPGYREAELAFYLEDLRSEEHTSELQSLRH